MDGINEEEEGSACPRHVTKELLFRQKNAQGAHTQNPRNPARYGVQSFRGKDAAMVHPRYCHPRGEGKATCFFRNSLISPSVREERQNPIIKKARESAQGTWGGSETAR